MSRNPKIRRIEAAMIVASILLGALMAHSTGLWLDGMERGASQTSLAKKELLASAGLAKLHHTVYAKVGEDRWESQVKPDFLGAITRATAREAGDPIPSWQMVVDWVRAHPSEARQMLENAAR